MKKINQVLTLVMLLGITQISSAENATSDFQVSTIVEPSCTVSAEDISFGPINLTSVSNVITNVATLSFLCSNNITVTIALSNGNAPSLVAGNTRYMLGTNGNLDKLYYGIFRPPGYPQAAQWASSASGPLSYMIVTTNGTIQTLPMTAKLNTNQIAMPDNYSDNVTVTLTY